MSRERLIPRDASGVPLLTRWRVRAHSRYTNLETKLEFDIPFGSAGFMTDHISRAIDVYYPAHSAIIDGAEWLNERLFAGLHDDNGNLRPGVERQLHDVARPKEMERSDLGAGPTAPVSVHKA